MNTTVIIQGSSKSNGDTNTILNYLNTSNQFDIIDLNTKNIGHFDYDFKNANDDFLPLMEEIIEKYDTIIFATPVYWYSMSGILKVFFDRISDLLKTEKDIGRKLRGKSMAMISCSNANDLKEGFSMPFIETANYLGMSYLGDIHAWVENGKISEEVKEIINTFRLKI
ncbi:MAG: multimeric flavodoxin WrbA [Candidatus Azotimanducaceae bacterium]|jgi:multimeric flavodoxin WrbA